MKKITSFHSRLTGAIVILLLFFTGCQKVYFDTMEAMGHPKREVLISRVVTARDTQTEAKEQFQSALEKFSSVVDFQGGDLEEKYKQLKTEFEKSRSKAKAVRSRIDAVEEVAEVLFEEWKIELDQYTSQTLRASSRRKLDKTRQRYVRLIGAMNRADEKIEPILAAFQDYVLFLKHNLNARAVASLQDELASVETDIASLIKEMESSIAEADAFINAMTEK